jgi:hypothetical protein
MSRYFGRVAAWCFWMIFLFLGGCGGDNLVELSGLVTFNGEPVKNGTISFIPIDGKGQTAGALIVEGRYSVQISPGKMKVEIQGYKEIGQQHAVEGDPTSPLVAKTVPMIPAKYNSQTTLTVDVLKSATQDFALIK